MALKVTVHTRIRPADGRQPFPRRWAESKQRKLKPGFALVDGQRSTTPKESTTCATPRWGKRCGSPLARTW